MVAGGLVGQAWADDGGKHTAAVQMGVAEVGSRDAKGSPLAYQGRAFPVGLQLQWRGDVWSGGAMGSTFFYGWNAGTLSADRPNSSTEVHNAEAVFVELAGWMQRAVVSGRSVRLSVGPQLSHWTFFRSYEYHPAQIGGVETWEATVSADARAELELRRGRFGAQLSANVAAVGRMMRPGHSIRGDERLALIEDRRRILSYGSWATAARLQMIHLDVGVRLDVSTRLALVAKYRAGVLNFRHELPTRAFRQQGLGGIALRF